MPATPHTSASIADALRSAGINVDLVGASDIQIRHIAPAQSADEGSVTFYRDAKFAQAWRDGSASAAIVSSKYASAYAATSPAGRPKRALFIVPDADLAFIVVLALFAPASPSRAPGIHPSAVVDPAATIDPAAHVGPLCVVEAGARVAAHAILVAGVHVGVGASVGEHSVLHPGVRVLDRCSVGKRCLLHSGATLGADGFGFRPGSAGLVKVPQIGNVVIHDDAEIGANSCVDRATIGSTVVGQGTKIDNIVQIGHNCQIGKHCVICGNSAIGGSVTLGDGVVLGGGAGIADGVTIGNRASVAARAGVTSDIPPGETWIGTPAAPVSVMRRNLVAFLHLAETLAEIKKKLR